MAADGGNRVTVQCRHGEAHHATIGMPGHVDTVGVDRDNFFRSLVNDRIDGHFQKEGIDGFFRGIKGRIVQTTAGHGRHIIVVSTLGFHVVACQESGRVETARHQGMFVAVWPHHDETFLFGLLHPSRVSGRPQGAAAHPVHIHNEGSFLGLVARFRNVCIKTTFSTFVIVVSQWNGDTGLWNVFPVGNRQCGRASVTKSGYQSMAVSAEVQATKKEHCRRKSRWVIREHHFLR
mmetsp:Transcript_18857/g.46810  ORF Transcript_18857/g.46810 Transcript_18857/m.46810 type:complete len:234 (-) Transcript_18857:1235-1936(-)